MFSASSSLYCLRVVNLCMSKLRPVLLNAVDTGGAANATRRIHEGLRDIGVESRMLVRQQSRDSPYIVGPRSKVGKALARIRPMADTLPLQLYEDVGPFSLDWVPDRIPSRISQMDPDLVHLNWIAGGYISISSLSDFDAPLVWRFPDMWPMTGGCHYSDGCDRYRDACGDCPKLDSKRSLDLSRVTMKRKQRALDDTDVTVVAPSNWLASCAEESALFGGCRIEVIPNGLDTDVFRPNDSKTGRNLFDLPTNSRLIGFGSVGPLSNPRKGFEPFQNAIKSLAADHDDIELVVFGASEPEDPPDFGLPTHYVGYLNDEQSLSLLYSCLDVMAVPSRYEGFGQTVTESMACGTPVVAFDATGPSDTVVHKDTGYLAEPYDPIDFANGIEWILRDEDLREQLEVNARRRAEEQYHYTTVARQYQEVYSELI